MKSCKFCLEVTILVVTFFFGVVVNAQSCITLQRQPGVCVPILTCRPVTQLLTLSPKPLPRSIVEIIKQLHCGTFDNKHYVCCDPNTVTENDSTPPAATTTATTTTTALPDDSLVSTKIRPSVPESSADIQSGMAILEGTDCGKSYGDRVANGVDAYLSQYPWMALLIYTDGLARTLDCGGALITDRYVLTAAHCIRTSGNKLVSVRLGEHDLKETIDCEGSGRSKKCAPSIQEIDVEEAIYHKDYNPTRFSDDIGLLRLKSPASFKTNVQPICLPITPASQGLDIKQMIIAGWGRIENGLRASVLQTAVIPVQSNENCQQVHRIIPITSRHMCAGGENEIDTCKGDSGGPLFYGSRYRRGARFVQYGVVSAGSSTCGSNFPGIYARLTSYLDWIAGNLSS